MPKPKSTITNKQVCPYANAFNFDASGAGHQEDKTTPPMNGGVWEMKYELDSLAGTCVMLLSYCIHSMHSPHASCLTPPSINIYIHVYTYLPTAFLRLSRSYHQATGDGACFHYTPTFEPDEPLPLWLRAVEAVLDVVQAQQAGTLEELGAEGMYERPFR